MKHLLRGAALVALFAISVPAWAQAPNTSPAPPSSAASAASEKPSAAPEAKADTKADTKADNWVRPRPHRQVRRSHRYARYRSPPYGSPHYWDRRWMSPADHAANDLNAYQTYGGGWGWGRGPYSRMPYTSY